MIDATDVSHLVGGIALGINAGGIAIGAPWLIHVKGHSESRDVLARSVETCRRRGEYAARSVPLQPANRVRLPCARSAVSFQLISTEADSNIMSCSELAEKE